MTEISQNDIEALYERFGSMVYGRCMQMLRNEDDAIEAMQDVFVKVLKMRDVDITSPSSLLYVMATRHCLNLLRSKKRRPEDANTDLVSRIANAGTDQRSYARMMLDWLFGESPEHSQLIAVLYYVDGLTHAEVADEVGMSVSSVRRRLKTMRDMLGELGETL